MDQAVTIPVLNRKIGLDALIGLVPYAGVSSARAGPVALASHTLQLLLLSVQSRCTSTGVSATAPMPSAQP
jgi:hypothetical protein